MQAPVTLRSIASVTFVPSGLFAVGTGAIMPVVPITAIDLGASTAVAAVVVALFGLGQLTADIPGGALTARFGERAVMIGAGVFTAIALAVAVLSTSLIAFTAAVFAVGMGTGVWLLSCLTLVAGVVPYPLRARAMATLGGARRIGLFIGPFIGAATAYGFDGVGPYLAAIVASAAAVAVLLVVARPLATRPAGGSKGHTGFRQVLSSEYRVFATVGVGVMLVTVVRASRQTVLPLWGEHLSLSPAVISLVYGVSGAADMLLFYPAGWLMDRFGRLVAALASTLGLAAGLLLLPLAGTTATFVLVAILLGLGNGIGSGLVMTVGADLAPPAQRAEFFGLWRLVADTGTGIGPFILAGVTTVLTLGAAALVMGGIGIAAAGVLLRWMPRKHTP